MSLNIIFAPADPAFAPWLYEQRKNQTKLRFNPLVPSTVEMLVERLNTSSSNFADYETMDRYFWFLKKDDTLVGDMCLFNLNRMMQIAEVGYAVAAFCRGQGIATQALQIFVKKVFAETPIRKLIAHVHEENQASRKVLERAGFVQEGLLRQHFIVNGTPANEAIYGLLRHEIVK